MTKIIFGPPGTGKTTRLLDYVDREISRGVSPTCIGFVSFTRRAAEEAITRACSKFSLPRDAFPYFRTLHSLCYRALGLSSSDVMTDVKMQEFAQYARIRVTGRWSEDGLFSGHEEGDRCLHLDNMSRLKMITLREQCNNDSLGVNYNRIEYFSSAMRAFKAKHNLLDYTDFLEQFLRLNLTLPDELETLIVDEAQDLSRLQWAVVHRLGGARRIVAGDDDQAIYRWAGADVNCLLELEGKREVLGRSWRVPRKVQDLALSLVGEIRTRQPKTWNARNSDGEIRRVYGLNEIDLSGKDILILVRNEFLMSRIKDRLRQEGIVYEAHGHSSIKDKFLDAAEVWESLRRNKAVTAAEARKVYSLMSVGLGVKRGCKTLPGLQDDDPVTLKSLRESGGLLIQDDQPWHDALDRIPQADISYMLMARQRGVKMRGRPSVRISTIHTAKGAEAEHVVVLKEMAKRSYQEMDINPDDERRVWYVAITRARQKLTLVHSSTERECQWL